MNKLLPLLCIALLAPAGRSADDTFANAVKSIDVRFDPTEAKPGQVVSLVVTINLADNWLTYPTLQPNPEISASKTRITLPSTASVVFLEGVKGAGPITDPPFRTATVGSLGEKRYYKQSVEWRIAAIVRPDAMAGKQDVKVGLNVIACVERKNADGTTTEACLNPERVTKTAVLTILDSPAIDISAKDRAIHDRVLLAAADEAKKAEVPAKKDTPPLPSSGLESNAKKSGLRIPAGTNYAADMAAVEAMLPKFETDNTGFLTFVLTAMFWGAVTLLTPCVFPMIPITVSYFLKQGEKKLHNPIAMATVYTITIVVVLGTAALFFLSFFSRLAVNPYMNTALGILFIVFAMSLFGMFDLVLPNFMVRFTSKREGSGGYGGVIFMALSFSIVSFTCVAPFLGGFAGMVSSGKFSNLQLAAGAFSFAGTFAAPFFLLAIFPSLLKKVPKSGSWMNTIKVVMGFLELAAALKFLRTAELRWVSPPALFTYDFVLSMYIVILILAGLYLLNLYRLPHDEPQDHIGVTRMLFGLVSISVALYLMPGLFTGGGQGKQRPGGTIFAWVDAFLLPEPGGAEVIGGESWSADLKRAIEESRATGEPIFIDFTGVTCTNCKLNEKDVFPQPGVASLMKQFRLVQLYTDEIPPVFYEAPPDNEGREVDARINRKFQKNVFGTEQLPLYVTLRPKPGIRGGPVEITGVYTEGKINNVQTFEAFLRKGLER